MTVDDTTSGLQRALDALTGATAAPASPPMQPVTPDDVAAESSGTKITQTESPHLPDTPAVVLTGPVNENWLELWYQPKIDLRQKCLAGAEAFTRIRHPDHGVLSVESYLESADEDSLARLIGRALVTTLSDWTKFGDAGFNLRLAINIPVNLLLRLPISELVNEHHPKSQQWPGLIVEVTEDQLVRDPKRVRDIANQLRANGIAIAIDDFGAGYSSFSAMRELAFAEIKIHKSFVSHCATDATNAAICQTAIDLAHRFGSTAVADGIENITDLQTLQIMGCDFGQGTLLAPPMTQERFLDLLQQRVSKPSAQQLVPAADGGPASSRLSA
jgi:EAL domain-containing protein (putative c-di-GMP-specific phosphodiesterase class I)